MSNTHLMAAQLRGSRNISHLGLNIPNTGFEAFDTAVETGVNTAVDSAVEQGKQAAVDFATDKGGETAGAIVGAGLGINTASSSLGAKKVAIPLSAAQLAAKAMALQTKNLRVEQALEKFRAQKGAAEFSFPEKTSAYPYMSESEINSGIDASKCRTAANLADRQFCMSLQAKMLTESRAYHDKVALKKAGLPTTLSIKSLMSKHNTPEYKAAEQAYRAKNNGALDGFGSPTSHPLSRFTKSRMSYVDARNTAIADEVRLAPPQQQQSQQQSQQQQSPQQSQQQQTDTSPEKKSNKGLIIGGSIVAVALVGGGIFLATRNRA